MPTGWDTLAPIPGGFVPEPLQDVLGATVEIEEKSGLVADTVIVSPQIAVAPASLYGVND